MQIIKTSDFEIEDLGIQEEWVYDIEVENNHNFFGNNILLHNSVYINVHQFILDNIGDPEKWINLSDDQKLEYIKKITKIVENYVNKNIYNLVQLIIYNSTESDFKILYEQEKICCSYNFKWRKKRE